MLIAPRVRVYRADDVTQPSMALLECLDVEVPERRKVVSKKAQPVPLFLLRGWIRVEKEPSG